MYQGGRGGNLSLTLSQDKERGGPKSSAPMCLYIRSARVNQKCLVDPDSWPLPATPLARFVAGEGKRRGCCGFFRNSRDARVRVQETVSLDNCQAFL